jgi:3',5'-nucleoside bisphosphate phosphatase
VTTPARSVVDLHCHTRRSDGVLEPLALYAAMRDRGMELVAVTDHDTLAAFRELRAAGLGAEASPDGPRLVPGVEVNTTPDPDGALGRGAVELHILGYGMDPDDPGLVDALEAQRGGRRTRIGLMLERLAELGLDVRDRLPAVSAGPGSDAGEGDDATEGSVGRPHVARALVAAGFATSIEDAFERLIGPAGPAWVPRIGLGPREAIARITAAGGLASLAHAARAPEAPELVETLAGWGLRGLEVHHPSFDDATSERMAAFAREAGLVATGGSDYHGDAMDYATAQAAVFVPPSVGEALLDALEGLAAGRGGRPGDVGGAGVP